jgi:acyl carrier protein
MLGSDSSPEQTLVLREQLPLPQAYQAPRTPTEQQLADIWRIVLGMDRIGVRDAYFDLGGDSFLATAIFHEIEETFHIKAPMALLVDAPTIAELATKIDGLVQASAGQS